MNIKKGYLAVITAIAIVAILIWQVLVNLNSIVDSCLDEGGSFNYESCTCDFDLNYEFSSEHLCD